ncbi:MAG: pyruvate dehydrogenase (acetyl-transferring), homodimeric type [Burkholderiales bacterium]|nr:pyruvate dehydrogenase (acetyl-transferring), homodimeric type [Burkholderiales bacterium]
MASLPDQDPQETQEWLDALEGVLQQEGAERAFFLLEKMTERARKGGAYLPFNVNTAYLNTIPAEREERSPGDLEMERRVRSYIRWNAMAMVVNANRGSDLGGHIASFASAATLYDVGFNHFFHAPSENHGGDLVYTQGHSAPGIYARAFLEGRITEAQMIRFRQESEAGGLSSYPHPWLMPDFWQFPTVSMGLGPLMAIYQARFMKYLEDRGIAKTEGRKVWAFMGDGEMDEPESLGAISLASRENLDNLVFVVNCNLQRLDGPVRGNGKIIQELEADFRGAGWNVIKVIWGSRWDPLLAKDKSGLLLKRMEEAVDGEYQNYKANDGAYVRKHFFGKYPELLDMVSCMSDEDIWRLNRGGHDPRKVYAAYAAAVRHKGQPTVILAKTVKGYGMGEAGEGQNTTHQQKKMGEDALKAFRNRFSIPISDEVIGAAPFYKPDEGSEEMNYLRDRVKAMGGSLPSRRRKAEALATPELSAFESFLKGTEGREISTTMAFVRILSMLVKDEAIGRFVVPIVPDESRTFGLDGLFRQLGIYSSVGQLYQPQDAGQLMYYREDKHGQILQEGINEAGAFSSWIAAATAYSTHGISLIPFYIYYSMFGFQRIGDLAWAAGDLRSRGFLLGGTAGRTTLNGEGLQHEDGHSHVLASTIPNCLSFDPAYAYELAVIIQDGMRRMYRDQEDIFYYITVMNENYAHPPMPEGAEAGILKGMYLLSEAKVGKWAKTPKVQLLGSGTILREVIAAADLLQVDFGVSADIWSVTSFNQLRRDGLECQRWNTLHPEEKPRSSYVESCLKDRTGPVIASTDYMKIHADQIRAFLPKSYRVLGTDGFGRSDTREKLRSFFEVDRHYVAVAALKALADEGAIPMEQVAAAIKKYGIDPEKPNPETV